jgi:nicotinamidase-related amidase
VPGINVRPQEAQQVFCQHRPEPPMRSHGLTTVLITGVNTNSCVLLTTIACSRDYDVLVTDDCVDTIDSPEVYGVAP